MTKLDKALNRIESAVDRLEAALIEVPADQRAGQQTSGDDREAQTALQVENDQLQGEVQSLRARAEEDARLRAEAADAVREALSDLRGAVTTQLERGEPANA